MVSCLRQERCLLALIIAKAAIAPFIYERRRGFISQDVANTGNECVLSSSFQRAFLLLLLHVLVFMSQATDQVICLWNRELLIMQIMNVFYRALFITVSIIVIITCFEVASYEPSDLPSELQTSI